MYISNIRNHVLGGAVNSCAGFPCLQEVSAEKGLEMQQEKEKENRFTEDIQKEWDAFFYGVSGIHASFRKESAETERKQEYVQETIL